MRKLRTNILLLTAILGTVGLAGQAWHAGKSRIAAPAGAESASVGSQPVASPPVSVDAAEPPDVPASAGVPAAAITIAPTAQPLSADASALLVETCNLQLMTQGMDFALDGRQWTAFAAVVLRFQAIRQTYEATIATVKVVAPGRYRVEIPAYTSAGNKLREQFSAELLAALGEPTALVVMAKLGGRLEERFAGFGVSMQTLDLTADPAGNPIDIQVTRTVSYWENAAGSDRVTTRREVQFPVVEDPTGDSWSALLAKVDAARPENGSG